MPLTFTSVLTDTNNSAGQTTRTTASTYTPTANTLQICTIEHYIGNTTADGTLTGAGLTWQLIYRGTQGGNAQRGFSVFRALGTGSTGALTYTRGSTDTFQYFLLAVTEVAGVLTTGSNGADAIAQQVVAASLSTASPSIAITPVSASNALFGAFATFGSTSTFTAGSGYTKFTDMNLAGNATLAREYRTTTASAIDGTWGTSQVTLGFGLEIVPAPTGPTITSQPTAQTARINGDTTNTATFSVAATTSGGLLTYDWELESGVGSGTYANLADGNGATWTGQAASSCVGTFTETTLTGRRLRCNVTDSNGTTTTDAVALTVLEGPVLSSSTATTNGSGVATVTVVTDDPLTANGELLLVTATASNGTVLGRTTLRPQDFTAATLTASTFALTANGSATTTLTGDVGVAASGIPVNFTVERVQVGAATSVVTADPTSIEADGVDSSTIRVVALTTDSRPLPGIPAASVVLAATGTGNTLTQPASATDASGNATGTLKSTNAATKVASYTVAGQAITDTASVVVTTPVGALTPVFFSDFSTATGTGSSAIGDGGKWGTLAGSGLEVIASTGFDFPTTNVLRVTAEQATTGFAFARKTGMSVPGIGDTRYYRWYHRVDSDTDVAVADNETHPVQDGYDASQANWMFKVYHNTGGANKWTPQFWAGNGTQPFPYNNWKGPALDKDATYRVEVKIDRTGTTTWKADIRIYNSSNVLVADSDDFAIETSPFTSLTTRMASNDFTFANVSNLAGLNCGSNGLGGTDWFPSIVQSYQAGFAVCDNQGWIGAFGSVTGE